ncbi:Rha family transcriptional regulator [Fusobacterium phage JD-Fnp2]|nr:Rha family transcriptional regulator [Fusobacterium phage JD-Fnp2]UTV61049.1 Rha family transcriptional regulator [Fusobacterium phage JD-Fnp3]UTV61131.1 Rha family transcriptional regulator [Fusobacterium phage JD-Fnp5]
MNEIINKDKITSLELVAEINKFRKEEGNRTDLQHKDLLKIIREEFSEEIGEGKISPTSYKDQWNREQPMFVLTLSQARQVLVRESKYVRKSVIHFLERLEEQLKNPFKKLSVQQMMIAALEEQEKIVNRVEILENKVDNEIRVDNGEQRKIQRAVATRVYQRLDIVPELIENKKFVFQAIYRDLKDRFGVASYRDIKRKDIKDCLEYISAWIEPADLRSK